MWVSIRLPVCGPQKIELEHTPTLTHIFLGLTAFCSMCSRLGMRNTKYRQRNIMSTSKPTILIVHGAYHCPAHFDRLASRLRSNGYVVEVPSLPSVGIDRDSGEAVSQDAAHILQTIVRLTGQGRHVAVFMHSLEEWLVHIVLSTDVVHGG